MIWVHRVTDPSKFTKSLKNIKNYIQKKYKSPDDIANEVPYTEPTGATKENYN